MVDNYAPPTLLLDSYVCGSSWRRGIHGLDPSKIQISASAGIAPITRKGYEASIGTDRCLWEGSVILIHGDGMMMGDPPHLIRPIRGDLHDLIIERIAHRSCVLVVPACRHPGVRAGHGKMILLSAVGP